MDNSNEPEDLLDGKIVFQKNKDRTFSKTKEPREKEKQRGRGEREETSAPFIRDYFLDSLACFFPTDCIGNYSSCSAVAMGLPERALGTPAVLSGAPLLSLWRLALLFFSIWELNAQTAVENKPLYIWQTAPPRTHTVTITLSPSIKVTFNLRTERGLMRVITGEKEAGVDGLGGSGTLEDTNTVTPVILGLMRP
ncbi:unnamed protein product [Pleuronectes platessa]|uniref:Uncharacterized protein n=1 Tax=Pleuronectes platessa TaxID=8262 RepID=A0A9N7Y4N5_PLEPL|nr:unnamed protein product [Pleuronectes platessa]